jgi:predicted amidohydrolase
MKICVAQTKSVKGDIEENIAHHKEIIVRAVSHNAGTIIFPELSLTGYEPWLAKDLATVPDDSRLDDFQTISDANEITIGVGMPTRNNKGICISMVLFQPRQPRQVYSKKYLHADEEPFFVAGDGLVSLTNINTTIALAICYELSIPEHAETAFKRGAKIYIASVAKTATGVNKAANSLSQIAKKYSMIVLMSNCIGHCDNFDSAGNSSAWNNEGVLIAQLNDTNEGILVFDTDSQKIIEEII